MACSRAVIRLEACHYDYALSEVPFFRSCIYRTGKEGHRTSKEWKITVLVLGRSYYAKSSHLRDGTSGLGSTK